MRHEVHFQASPEWIARFRDGGLDSFDAWWALALAEVEPGNRRRGGWGQVFRCVVGGTGGLFVKRQEDHVYRSWRHPLLGRLTVEREFQALSRCREVGVAVTETVLYAARLVGRRQRGVLVTRELEGYRALDALMLAGTRPDRVARDRVLRQTAALVRRLHAAHLEHGCLYPKHVMVHEAWLAGARIGSTPPVVLIDLEKCMRRWRRAACRRRDLDSLNRRAGGWSRAERRRFLGYYLSAGRRLDPAGRRLWRTLARRVQRSAVASVSTV